jgi:small subunit ribosomal protein S1
MNQDSTVLEHTEDDYLVPSDYRNRGAAEGGVVRFTHENGKHYFAVVDSNGGLVYRSEGYSSESSRENGLESVAKNITNPKRFAIEEKRGFYYVIIKAGNHQEIARSVPFASEEVAKAMIPVAEEAAAPVAAAVVAETVVEAAPAAAVVTETVVEAAPAAAVVTETVVEAAPVVAAAVAETVVETVAAPVAAAPVAKKAAAAPAAAAVATETEEEEEPLALEIDSDVAVSTSSAFDDFDWGRSKRGQIRYSEADSQRMFNDYDESMKALAIGEVVKGRVSAISGNDVVLDINYKSDGLLPLSDFREIQDLKIGDYVDVYIESQEDAKGQLQLSRRKAKLLRAWEAILDSFKNHTVIRGTVISKTKGGLIVDAGGLETFLPGSQIDIKPVVDYDQYVGKVMEFKVVKVNEVIKNAVVSHKALIESDLAEQREAILGGLEKGQVLEGTVKNITDFGAFLDLGGVDGLLYITDISWGRITHPREVLELNQKINVVVLDFDENKKRISLGLKQLLPHPWEVLDATIVEGSTVKGKIVNIEDYGAFLEIQPGVEGLIHVSEVTWANQPIVSKEFFKGGSEMEAKVVTLDRGDRKMSLSIKQLTGDPWGKIEEKYAAGTRHTGEVKNLTQYGVFIELEPGVGGMIHISDLSWTKRFAHPSEFTKVGNKIDVMVLEADKETRKLSLGHKQVENDPWEGFESLFPISSTHEATVLRKDDRGAIVALPHGLEAFAPMKHIRKDDNTTAEVGEVLTVKVIEFNKDDRRILVSHSKFNDDLKREADDKAKKERQVEAQEARKEVENVQKNVEKDTLGDLSALSALKEQLEG